MSNAAPKAHARRLGLLEATLSGVGFGFLGVLGKAAFDLGFSPGEQLALRFLAAAAMLWLYLIAARPKGWILSPKATLKCAGLGIFGYAIFASLYFEALRGLSASLTVLLLYTYPAIVALAAWAMFGQRPGRRKLACFVLVMGGLALLVWGDLSIGDPTAVVYGLGAAALYSVYILASSRLVATVDPIVSVCYIQTAAGAALALAHLHDGGRVLHLVSEGWWIIALTAVFCTVAPMLLFLRALQKLTPADVSLISTAEPITGVVAAALVLGERLGPMQIVGAIVIIVALVYMSRPETLT